ncbi:DUF1838 family protein [Spongiivirga sp. MCCC 1A20706]|uniref:DUF1838 family protein n=1 Tax=Spongiivirga sp. MCCC 1A20706 TaxID=3160963 RepID=UPI0039772B8C
MKVKKLIALIAILPFLVATAISCNEKQKANESAEKEPAPVTKKLAYDLNDPKDQLLIFEKLQGDLSGKKTYSYSEGRVFGIRPDKPDSLDVFGKEVFRYSGCGMKIMRLLEDGNVETKSKGWLLYQDPKTGEYVSEMRNPYTGKVVDVPPFRAGIRGGIMTPEGPKVDANFTMESTAFGQPLNLVFTEIGDRMHVTRHAFTKWFEKKSQTWRTEMTLDTYDFDKSYLYDRSHPHIPADTHWTSETSWLSILDMAGTPGHMIWASSGGTYYNKEDLPAEFIAATEAKQPDIFGEPLEWEENEE